MTAVGAGPYPSQWRFDSGRVCLDLVATAQEADRRAGGTEPLADTGRLARWLVGAGLVPAGTPLHGVDSTWVAGFVELRECIDRLVRTGPKEGRADDALEMLNARAQEAPPGIRAVKDGKGTLVRALCAAPECAALLAVVARDAVELLTDPVARSRLRQCEGDNCRRVYLDTSRGRRRRWCSSEVCGNRERVARHRRKASVKES
ncbi:ABATE domain-containing protein [Streptomyces sp. V1I6]|uniref:CGNR zinc finger domain-containing protein n=1 Tax=Streptomyces sp. V1I6 TaxID=3042273 RepID=UPI00277EC28B|nr:ABATE domain-containing protein [Streptomyces sp. V1I6]MDQ0843092.1 putative RNA-binding Zn ribbon-like protein [Streptomyces sp. V1I6]